MDKISGHVKESVLDFLMVQRVESQRLPVQGILGLTLLWEDSICCWATKPAGPRVCSATKETTANEKPNTSKTRKAGKQQQRLQHKS